MEEKETAAVAVITSDPVSKDFYVRLGVDKSATEKEITNAYRKLALK